MSHTHNGYKPQGIENRVRRAKSNKQFALDNETESPSWAIIIYFYSAIHYVNACLEKDELGHLVEEMTGSPHENTKVLVKDEYNEIATAYHCLFSYGFDARYDTTWNPAPDRVERARGWVDKIEEYSTQHLAK